MVNNIITKLRKLKEIITLLLVYLFTMLLLIVLMVD